MYWKSFELHPFDDYQFFYATAITKSMFANIVALEFVSANPWSQLTKFEAKRVAYLIGNRTILDGSHVH